MSYLRIISAGNFIGISHAVQFHLVHHVRLTRAKPYITEQDIVNDKMVGGINGHSVRSAGLHGGQLQQPVTIRIRGSLKVLSVKLYPDRFIFSSPSPDIYF